MSVGRKERHHKIRWFLIQNRARGLYNLNQKGQETPLSAFVSIFTFGCKNFLVFWELVGVQGSMSQSSLLNNEGLSGLKIGESKRLRIKVPTFDNGDLIKGYNRTLIGRCMNPSVQHMENLLYMLPRIWNVEERVAGADLGNGCFQFDFDKEEDIVNVLKMEPFHFDRWMLSIVRWEPVVDVLYPSEITFWIKVKGVPLQYWAEQTFQSIGKAIGTFKELDLNLGRVKVSVNGFKPLHFVSDMEFGVGEETVVNFHYERLYGFCRRCHSLCHSEDLCGLRGGTADTCCFKTDSGTFMEPKSLSYKGALVDEGDKGSMREKHGVRRRLPLPETERTGGKGFYSDNKTREGTGRHWITKPNAPISSAKKDEKLVDEGHSNKRNKTMAEVVEAEKFLTSNGVEKQSSSEKVNSPNSGTMTKADAMEELKVMQATDESMPMAEDTETVKETTEENEVMGLEPLTRGEFKDGVNEETSSDFEDDDMMGEPVREEEITRGEEKQGARKRLFPVTTMSRGMGSKKRNALILASPRKPHHQRNAPRLGDGLNPKPGVVLGKKRMMVRSTKSGYGVKAKVGENFVHGYGFFNMGYDVVMFSIFKE